MSSFGSTSGRVLYLAVCAVPGAELTVERIKVEQDRGWEVCVVATERALHWFDPSVVEATSGHAIQSQMRVYGEPLFEPLGDAIVVAPASFNTINKIALGLADDMVSGLTCEAIGRGVPVTIEAQLGPAFAAHPAYTRHRDQLREMGVTFIDPLGLS